MCPRNHIQRQKYFILFCNLIMVMGNYPSHFSLSCQKTGFKSWLYTCYITCMYKLNQISLLVQRDKLFALKVHNAFSKMVYVRCLSYYLFTYIPFSPYPEKDLTLGKAAMCSRRDPQRGCQLKAVCCLYSQYQGQVLH